VPSDTVSGTSAALESFETSFQQDLNGDGGHWVPIGAEKTATGYEVVWEIAGADKYTVWFTDSNGNYLSSAFDTVSGTSNASQSFETSFDQDLNGDGVIGDAICGLFQCFNEGGGHPIVILEIRIGAVILDHRTRP
jgi:hypothetical protein